MILDALDAGVPAGWVTADEVYGNDPALRHALEHRGIGYVLVVACDHRLPAYGGTARADQLAAGLPARSWQPISAGPGAKGPRVYQWAWLDLAEAGGEHRWLLIRRTPTTGELAYYRCWAPQPTTLRELVRVAGIRWAVEECFQTSKDQVGMDHYQVRGWTPWHRFITLTMLALAVLVAITAAADQPTSDSLIALTVAEVQRLLTTPSYNLGRILRWPLWRRQSPGPRAPIALRTATTRRRRLDHEVPLEYWDLDSRWCGPPVQDL